MATNQPQQPGITVQSYQPQYVQQQPQVITIPPQLKRTVLFLSIALLVGASASIIFGFIAIALRFYNIANFSGANIWGGLFYLVCGALGVSQYRNTLNPSLIHAFYALSITGLVVSVPHIAISIVAFSGYGFVVGIISVIFALIGFSLSLALVIILSQHIYCGINGLINKPHYAGTTVTVSQPGVVYAGNPAGPQQQYVYNQQMPVGGMAQPVQTPNQQFPAGGVVQQMPVGGMAQPVQTPNQQFPAAGVVQPVPSVNSQPTNTMNEKPPIA